jgi:SAM-dependent methyltransferase
MREREVPLLTSMQSLQSDRYRLFWWYGSDKSPSEMQNKLQIELWNGRAGASWVRHNTLLETLLKGPGLRCLDQLDLESVSHALDIGCGCGNQTLSLAERLSKDAKVTGVDVSEPMLALARDAVDHLGNDLCPIDFVCKDASQPVFPAHHFDAVYSRFGVMFFDEPTEAFTHIRASMKPTSPLAFICWQAPQKNPFFSAPMQAALTVLPAPPAPPAGAPGPFAFADDSRVNQILTDAGFNSIDISPLNQKLSVGAGAPFDELFGELIEIGPASALIAESDPSLKESAKAAVAKALRGFYDEELGMSFEANFWLVTARA